MFKGLRCLAVWLGVFGLIGSGCDKITDIPQYGERHPTSSLLATTQDDFTALRSDQDSQPFTQKDTSSFESTVCSSEPEFPYDFPRDKVEPSRRVGWLRPEVSVSSSGAAVARVEIQTAPGRAGMVPNLKLIYSSDGGSSILGEGWSLTGISSISRVPQTTSMDGVVRRVDFTESDRLALDGEPMIAIAGQYWGEESVYKSSQESFNKVQPIFGRGVQGPYGFVVKDNEGNRIWYGGSSDSCIERSVVDEAERLQGNQGIEIRDWYIRKIQDKWGNTIEYRYEKTKFANYSDEVDALEKEGFWIRPVQILYTGYEDEPGLAVVEFSYEKNPSENRWRFEDGVRYEQASRLKGIVSRGVDGGVFRRYKFAYQNHSMTGKSLLERMEQCDARICQQETVFEWTHGEPGKYSEDVYQMDAQPELMTIADGARRTTADFDGDGYDDVLYPNRETYWVAMGSEAGLVDARDTEIRIPPPEDIISDNPFHRPKVWVDDFSLIRMSYEGFIPVDWNRDGKMDLFFISAPTRFNEPDVTEDDRLAMLKHYFVFVSRGRDEETGRFLGFDVENTFIRREQFPIERGSTVYFNNTPSTTTLSDINGDGIEDLLYMLPPSEFDSTGAERAEEPYPVLGYRLGRWSEGLGHLFFDVPVSTGIPMGGVRYGNVTPSVFPQTGDYDGDGDFEVLMTIADEQSRFSDLHVIDFVAERDRYCLRVELRRVDDTRHYYSEAQLREERGFWRPMTLDANGDGLDDILYLGPYADSKLLGPFESSNMRIQINQGAGKFASWRAIEFLETNPDFNNRVYTHQLYPMDDNMDGIADFLVTGVHKNLARGRKIEGWYILRGRGNGFQYDIVPVQGIENDAMLGTAPGIIDEQQRLSMGDYNGDGLTDVLYRSGLRALTAMTRTSMRPDYLKRVTDGSGFEWNIRYAELHKLIRPSAALKQSGQVQYPFVNRKSKRWVVLEHDATQLVWEEDCDDAMAPDEREQLAGGCLEQRVVREGYGDEIYHDTYGRLGFYHRTARDMGGHTVSEKFYEQLFESVQVRKFFLGNESTHTVTAFPYGGLPTMEQTLLSVDVERGAQLRPITRTFTTWETSISQAFVPLEERGDAGKQNYWTYPKRVENLTFDPFSDVPSRPISKSVQRMEYDEVGHLVQSNYLSGLTGLDGQWRHDAQGHLEVYETEQQYSFDDAPVGAAMVGQQSHSKSIMTAPGGQRNVVEMQVLERDEGTGAVISSVSHPGTEAEMTTKLTYDLYGNIVRHETRNRQGKVRFTETTYDPFGMFGVCTKNTLGHENAFGWNRDLGVQVWQKDANDIAIFYSSDGFGRPKKLWTPLTQGLAEQGLEEAGQPNYLVRSIQRMNGSRRYPLSVVHTSSGSAKWNKVTSDINGRPVLSESLALQAEGEIDFLISSKTYDRQGRVRSQQLPILKSELEEGAQTFETQYEYDALGRVTKAIDPDLTSIEQIYHGLEEQGLRTETINKRGQASNQWQDILGRPVMVQDALGGVQRYNYGICGLEQFEDAEQNISTTKYDRFCRQIQVIEPNKGLVKTQYDAWGQIEKTSSFGRKRARVAMEQQGQAAPVKQVHYLYDALGRRSLRVAGLSVEGAQPREWTRFHYDSAEYGVGKIHGVEHFNGVRERFEYDMLGRPSINEKVIEGRVYTSRMQYDQLTGNLSRLQYPQFAVNTPTVEVSFEYDALGRLIEVSDAQDNHAFWSLQAFNRYGQITAEQFGNGVRSFYEYDLSRGHLTAQRTTLGEHRPVVSLSEWSYTYGEGGNLLSRNDHTLNQSEQFTYDALDRLSMVKQFSSGILTAEHGYQYSRTGNLIQKTDLTDQWMMYGEGTAGPHALTSYGQERIEYDIFGNALQSHGKRFSYTWFNKPSEVLFEQDALQMQSVFSYGPNHERVIKESLSGKTHYVGGGYQYEWHEDGTERIRITVRASGKPVATVTYDKPQGQVGWQDKQTEYLHLDRLGSIDLVTSQDPERGGIERLSFDVFGKRRDPFAWDQSIELVGERSFDMGFTGHEHDDELGLIHMKGRMMDPRTGRFLNSDPLPNNLLFSQDANRYSYVRNNPLRFTDPSGFSPSGMPPIGIDDTIDLSNRDEDSGPGWMERLQSWFSKINKPISDSKHTSKKVRLGRDGGNTSTNSGQVTDLGRGGEFGGEKGMKIGIFSPPVNPATIRILIKELIKRYLQGQKPNPGMQPGVQPGVQPGIQPMPLGAPVPMPNMGNDFNPYSVLALITEAATPPGVDIPVDQDVNIRRSDMHKYFGIVLASDPGGYYMNIVENFFLARDFWGLHYDQQGPIHSSLRTPLADAVIPINPIAAFTDPFEFGSGRYVVTFPGFNHYPGYPDEALQAALIGQVTMPVGGYFIGAFTASPEEFMQQIRELATLPGTSSSLEVLAAAAAAGVPGASVRDVFVAMGLPPLAVIEDPLEIAALNHAADIASNLPSGLVENFMGRSGKGVSTITRHFPGSGIVVIGVTLGN